MKETEIAERFIKCFAVAARQAGAVALRLQGKARASHKPGKYHCNLGFLAYR